MNFIEKKLTTVIGMFLLFISLPLSAIDRPKAFIITGEQSGEDLARWFVQTTKLDESHNLFIVASKALAEELGINHLDGFESLAGVTILHGVGSLLKELIAQRSTYNRLIQTIIDAKPERLILIDRPWVNVRLARAIKKAAPSISITYAAPPELWFWGCWYIDTILKNYCDELIVLCPHEQAWYAQRGLTTKWLGYPYAQEFEKFLTQEPISTNELALLPGSRLPEVQKSLPLMCEAIKQSKVCDQIKIIVVQAASIPREVIDQIIAQHGLTDKIRIVSHDDKERLSRCFYALTKPGTITLHLALLGVPHAVVFKTSWVNSVILNYIIKPKAFGLPNLLSPTSVCDEFIQETAHVSTLAAHLDEVFLSFKEKGEAYKLRQQKINLFRNAFLKQERT